MANGTFTIFDTDPLLNPEGNTDLTGEDPEEGNLVLKLIRERRERQEKAAKAKLEVGKTEKPAEEEQTVEVEEELIFEYGQTSLIGREDFILDSDWSKHAFSDMTAPSLLDNTAEYYGSDGKRKENPYYRTSADYKFEDSSLGGGVGVGTKPQYCRYSDVRAAGLTTRDKTSLNSLKPSTSGLGMGRYYSEQVDDQQQILFMRFGIVEFSSLGYFFNTLIKSDMRKLFTHGQASSIAYAASKAVGNALLLYRHPLGMISVFLLTDVAKVVISQRTRFYNIKPTMYIYWNIVYTIINQIMANTHFQDLVEYGKKDIQSSVEIMDGIGKGDHQTEDVLKMMGIRMRRGRIDVIATVNRVTMQYNNYCKILSDEEERLTEAQNKPTAAEGIKSSLQSFANMTMYAARSIYPEIDNITKAIYSSDIFAEHEPPVSTGQSMREAAVAKAPPKKLYNHPNEPTVKVGRKANAGIMDDSSIGILEAELDQGSAFAIFKVDSVKEYSESFSNSTKKSATAGSLNGIASSSRTVQHTIAGGNIGDSPIAKLAEAALDLALDSIGGLADGLTLSLASGIKGVLSGIEVDIPDEWEGSNTALPEAKYTMTLTSLYNNPISMMTGIYLPVSMWLAGTLPMQTGPRSNTTPLLCESYLRGGVYKTLGIIKSLSITRGGGNLGFDAHGAALRLKLDVTIQDLSTVITAPIVDNHSYLIPGYDLGADSALNEYLSVLSGLSVYDEIFPIPAITRRLNSNINNLSTMFSSGNIYTYFGSNAISNTLKGVFGTTKALSN